MNKGAPGWLGAPSSCSCGCGRSGAACITPLRGSGPRRGTNQSCARKNDPMPLIPRLFLPAAAALLPAMAAYAQPRPSDCAPGAPCSKPLSVRVVIVTMFEIGADTGDAPGEFQLWKERRKLDTRIPFPQGYHDLYYNPDSRILAMVTGVGTARSGTGVMALGLDPRFDLSKAYWLVAGIAGIDPQDASIGSAAWARYSVDGDLAHEIDAREIPTGWKSGFFPLDKQGPDDKSPPITEGRVFALSPRLTVGLCAHQGHKAARRSGQCQGTRPLHRLSQCAKAALRAHGRSTVRHDLLAWQAAHRLGE